MAEREQLSRQWSGADFRSMLTALYPRPGWKARNLDADSGRTYDLVDWRDRRAMVDVDWDMGYTAGYIGEDKVREERGCGDVPLRLVAEAVEDELMRRENHG